MLDLIDPDHHATRVIDPTEFNNFVVLVNYFYLTV